MSMSPKGLSLQWTDQPRRIPAVRNLGSAHPSTDRNRTRCTFGKDHVFSNAGWYKRCQVFLKGSWSVFSQFGCESTLGREWWIPEVYLYTSTCNSSPFCLFHMADTVRSPYCRACRMVLHPWLNRPKVRQKIHCCLSMFFSSMSQLEVTCHAGDLPSHEKIASKITYPGLKDGHATIASRHTSGTAPFLSD